MRDAWVLSDVRATEEVGAALARCCPWGRGGPRCMFLCGELGAGKTTLAAAALEALGVHETVRSPTYALIEVYPVSAGVAVHMDLYRLGSAEEVEQLGLRDYLRADTLILIEWPQRAREALPQPDLLIELQVAGQGRMCRIEAIGSVGEEWLARVAGQLTTSQSGLA